MHMSSEIRRFDSFPQHGGVIGVMLYGIGREGDQSLIYVDLYPFFVILACRGAEFSKKSKIRPPPPPEKIFPRNFPKLFYLHCSQINFI
jgi:hypothetical protein